MTLSYLLVKNVINDDLNRGYSSISKHRVSYSKLSLGAFENNIF